MTVPPSPDDPRDPSGHGPSGSGGPIPDGVPDFDGPAPQEPDFLPCYRHPERTTGISCQRCHRPICMQCMHEAPVGFHCPSCAGADGGPTGRGISGGRAGRAGRSGRSGAGGGAGGNPFRSPGSQSTSGGTGFMAALNLRSIPVTAGIVAVCLLIGIVDLVTRNLATNWLALSGLAIDDGQWWRLVTWSVTSAGLFGLLINGLVMVLIGRALEGMLGSGRMLAIFLTATLVGGALFVLVSQGLVGITGMNTGTIGLIAASAAVKLRMGHDIRFDLVLLGLLVVLSFVAGFGSFHWLAQIGGVLGGGGAALIMLFAPGRRDSRTKIQTLGIAAVWVVALAAVWLGLIVL